jgi:23S rRNA pseudouridine1911/1915/1917 synthase
LDKDTSGLLVLAKTEGAFTSLKEQFKNKTAKRIYWALHFGKLKVLSGQWSTHLARHPKNRLKFSSQEIGKHAVTNFRSITQGPISLTELALETGRTHQIRVHLSENQLPILNDSLYGSIKNINSINDISLKTKLKQIKRMALVARKLSFNHPVSKEDLTFEVPWPEELNFDENVCK